jgi:hypothetical protein
MTRLMTDPAAIHSEWWLTLFVDRKATMAKVAMVKANDHKKFFNSLQSCSYRSFNLCWLPSTELNSPRFPANSKSNASSQQGVAPKFSIRPLRACAE